MRTKIIGLTWSVARHSKKEIGLLRQPVSNRRTFEISYRSAELKNVSIVI